MRAKVGGYTVLGGYPVKYVSAKVFRRSYRVVSLYTGHCSGLREAYNRFRDRAAMHLSIVVRLVWYSVPGNQV
jgi:hypothetical protein